LERHLDTQEKQWYDQHWVIMEYPVPKEISANQETERSYFLHLTPDLQRKYIEYFWTIRDQIDFTREEFVSRIDIANKWFRGEGLDGYLTDRGKIMLLCGQPDWLEFRDSRGNTYIEGDEQWFYNRNNKYYQQWIYWYGVGFWQQLIRLTFVYDEISGWHYLESTDTIIQGFIQYHRWKTAPTKEGWELWRKANG
jgi:GWxTD domain-containing protein